MLRQSLLLSSFVVVVVAFIAATNFAVGKPVMEDDYRLVDGKSTHRRTFIDDETLSLLPDNLKHKYTHTTPDVVSHLSKMNLKSFSHSAGSAGAAGTALPRFAAGQAQAHAATAIATAKSAIATRRSQTTSVHMGHTAPIAHHQNQQQHHESIVPIRSLRNSHPISGKAASYLQTRATVYEDPVGRSQIEEQQSLNNNNNNNNNYNREGFPNDQEDRFAYEERQQEQPQQLENLQQQEQQTDGAVSNSYFQNGDGSGAQEEEDDEQYQEDNGRDSEAAADADAAIESQRDRVQAEARNLLSNAMPNDAAYNDADENNQLASSSSDMETVRFKQTARAQEGTENGAQAEMESGAEFPGRYGGKLPSGVVMARMARARRRMEENGRMQRRAKMQFEQNQMNDELAGVGGASIPPSYAQQMNSIPNNPYHHPSSYAPGPTDTAALYGRGHFDGLGGAGMMHSMTPGLAAAAGSAGFPSSSHMPLSSSSSSSSATPPISPPPFAAGPVMGSNVPYYGNAGMARTPAMPYADSQGNYMGSPYGSVPSPELASLALDAGGPGAGFSLAETGATVHDVAAASASTSASASASAAAAVSEIRQMDRMRQRTSNRPSIEDQLKANHHQVGGLENQKIDDEAMEGPSDFSLVEKNSQQSSQMDEADDRELREISPSRDPNFPEPPALEKGPSLDEDETSLRSVEQADPVQHYAPPGSGLF